LESIYLDDDTYDDLPFEYRGGYLGFLGYEVGQDTQRALQQLEGGLLKPLGQASSQSNKTPSAAFLFADQSLVYDHWEQEWYLVGLASNNNDAHSSVLNWMDRVEQVLWDLQSPEVSIETTNDVETRHRPFRHRPPLAFVPNRSPHRYRSNIATCHEEIRLGESYELCLTNQLEATVSQAGHSPLQLYKVLRQRNPVPFAAFINFQQGAAPVSVCCSSPERFVSVKKQSPDSPRSNDDTQQDGDSLYVEAKPIKGTCARQVVTDRPRTVMEQQEDARRARELESSVKNRAENLMIVDLLRNDLNRVCRVGSVHVPKLMHIESYTTVHQMVSTIRGILSQDKNAIDVLQACFPGGSMTGAPKLRSMEILNELEEGVPRGPYSGCLGYISLNGSMDMNIVIRSAVLTPENNDWHVRIGAGGAITALSESEDEYEEMLLKARAVVEAVQAWSDAIPEVLKKEEAPTVPTATNNITLSTSNTV
jgi:para-aminobenzoate synthetase